VVDLILSSWGARRRGWGWPFAPINARMWEGSKPGSAIDPQALKDHAMPAGRASTSPQVPPALNPPTSAR